MIRNVCLCLSLEFKSASQARAAEGPSDWLDVVLPGNSLLQTKMGGRPKNCIHGTEKTQRLSRMYVGK